MVTRRFVMLAALTACGGPKQPIDNPMPTGSASQVRPVDAAVAVVTPNAPPPAPAKKPWSRDTLPTWEPVKQDPNAETTEPITVWAVDTNGDWLLREVAPRINYVFVSTDKRLTGQLDAPPKFDAFATIAGLLGVKVEPIKPKGKGATIAIDFIGGPFHDLVRFIGETGHVNIVVAPGELPTLNVRLIRIPWDQALELMIDRVGWTYTREGNAFFIVPKGTKLGPAPKLPGAVIDVDAKDATVAQIVTGARVLRKLETGSCSATKVSLQVKRVAPGTLAKAIEVVSGEKLADKAECPWTPLGDQTIADLKLVAIVGSGTQRIAVFDHNGATVIGKRNDGNRLKDIGQNYVTFVDTAGAEVSLQLRTPAPDPAPDDVVKAFTRTSALVRRGEKSIGIVETAGGPRSAVPHMPASDGISFEVNYDGVHVMRDSTEVRMVPLSP